MKIWKKFEKQGKYRLITQRVLNPNANPCEGSIQSYIPSVGPITKWGALVSENSMVTISLDL